MLDRWALESGEGRQERELRKSERFVAAHPSTTYGISFIPQPLPAGSGPGFSFTDPRRCRSSMPGHVCAHELLRAFFLPSLPTSGLRALGDRCWPLRPEGCVYLSQVSSPQPHLPETCAKAKKSGRLGWGTPGTSHRQVSATPRQPYDSEAWDQHSPCRVGLGNPIMNWTPPGPARLPGQVIVTPTSSPRATSSSDLPGTGWLLPPPWFLPGPVYPSPAWTSKQLFSTHPWRA